MSVDSQQIAIQSIQEILIVTVADCAFGIDINQTLGINRVIPMTRVPKSPEYVCGIINLRGQVVTVLDLGVRLGREAVTAAPQNRIIIVQDNNENIGLLVDKVIDVIPVNSKNIEPAPANLGGIVGKFFHSVYRDDNRVNGILDIMEIISVDI